MIKSLFKNHSGNVVLIIMILVVIVFGGAIFYQYRTQNQNPEKKAPTIIKQITLPYPYDVQSPNERIEVLGADKNTNRVLLKTKRSFIVYNLDTQKEELPPVSFEKISSSSILDPQSGVIQNSNIFFPMNLPGGVGLDSQPKTVYRYDIKTGEFYDVNPSLESMNKAGLYYVENDNKEVYIVLRQDTITRYTWNQEEERFNKIQKVDEPVVKYYDANYDNQRTEDAENINDTIDNYFYSTIVGKTHEYYKICNPSKRDNCLSYQEAYEPTRNLSVALLPIYYAQFKSKYFNDATYRFWVNKPYNLYEITHVFTQNKVFVKYVPNEPQEFYLKPFFYLVSLDSK